jgi:hypothetical protein
LNPPSGWAILTLVHYDLQDAGQEARLATVGIRELTKLLVGALLLVCAVVAPANAQQPIVTIPYFIDEDGAISVAVTINGRGPYKFIVDTGATVTLAFRNLAAIENFEPTGGPPRRVLGINGSATLDTFAFGDVALGPATMSDHVGVILDDWAPPRQSPHGILGIDFFRRYAVVFDVSAKTMSLYPHGGIPKSTINRWREIRLNPKTYANLSGALFTTTGYLHDSPMTFIIDLGSIASLVNYTAAQSLYSGVLTRGAGGSLTTGSRLADVFDDRTQTKTGRFNRVRIGPAIWRRVVMWLRDAPIFEELGVAEEPYGLLGADLIAAQDFALDFGENRLYLSRASRK